jgi:four helix bundle protein
MKDFRKYKVWEKSHQLVLRIYELSLEFPKDETYGLTSQIKRASSSIAINIAEGCGYDTDAEFRRFLKIASGSASETEYLLILLKDLKLITEIDFEVTSNELIEIRKMLNKLIQKLKAKSQ